MALRLLPARSRYHGIKCPADEARPLNHSLSVRTRPTRNQEEKAIPADCYLTLKQPVCNIPLPSLGSQPGPNYRPQEKPCPLPSGDARPDSRCVSPFACTQSTRPLSHRITSTLET